MPVNSGKASILIVIPGEITRSTGGSIYDKKLADYLVAQGYRLEIASLPDLPFLASLIAGVFISPRLLLRVMKTRHDIVIEDGWVQPALVLFNMACRLTGRTRLLLIVHQLRWQGVSPPFTFLARMVEKTSVRSADLIVAVSRFMKNQLEQLVGDSERIIIAPPGSEVVSRSTRKWIEKDETSLRLLFVGNCTRLKGLIYLIRALGLLNELALKLDVVGDIRFDPRYFDRVRRLANRLKVDDRITFHGLVTHKQLGLFYSKADIFTFPSLYEGYGIVLGEAMHAGLAIITTRVGSIGEIVQEGENALVVPTADSEALAAAIRTLVTDASIRRRFGEKSRELAELLPTWRQTCEAISDSLGDILPENRV